MKHLVVQSELRSAEIRPPALLESWLTLAEAASVEMRANIDRLARVNCPGCDSAESEFAFTRLGFTYERCARCASIFVQDRPDADTLALHYRDSAAAEFRIGYFAEQTASARFRHIIQSRVDWIGQLVGRSFTSGQVRFADVGTLYPGLFQELHETGEFSELSTLETDSRIIALLPSFVTIGNAARQPHHIISAFEQLEHQFSPFSWLVQLRESLVPRGVLLLTTRSGTGFDLSVLGGHARYLLVPEHLNLLSLRGLELLMARAGFDLFELSTPGELDISLVRDTLAANPTLQVSDFVKSLAMERGEVAHRDFQEFLQKHRLSSHVRLAARRVD